MYEDNETLAFEAQNGDMEAMHALYANVKKRISLKANKFFVEHARRCAHAGVTRADLEQEGYFAFVQAVNAYEPESEYKFASYLHYPLLTAFYAVCGMRTRRMYNEPLNNAVSLDTPIGDGEDGLTLYDIIPDDTTYTAEQVAEDYDRAVMRQDIETAIDKLPYHAAYVIRHKYLYGQTVMEIAKQRGVSWQAASYSRIKGMTALRQNEHLRLRYFDDVISRHAYNGGVGSFNHTWTSSTERAAMKLEEWEAVKQTANEDGYTE
ncbi:MAG: sigma-70 family RNA polymerase sigma factor [Clostridiales bacterium]|nr:sigma-70 family RNA polymerase sigma factor [Clostridiales bacterium]